MVQTRLAQDIARVVDLELRLSIPLFLSILSSLLLMLSIMREIPTFLYWHHYPLGLQCSWYTWQQFQLQKHAIIQLGALTQLLFTTRTKPGMTMCSLITFE
ncbi:hypothetical protein CRYUN_Cryun05aG0121300 [Craigia yunnanensis]